MGPQPLAVTRARFARAPPCGVLQAGDGVPQVVDLGALATLGGRELRKPLLRGAVALDARIGVGLETLELRPDRMEELSFPKHYCGIQPLSRGSKLTPRASRSERIAHFSIFARESF